MPVSSRKASRKAAYRRFICGSGVPPHFRRRIESRGRPMAQVPALQLNKDMCPMKSIRVSILAGSSVLLLAACATTPPGPMIPVMPGPHKSPAAFNADQMACEQYATDVVQGHVQESQNREVTNGVVGGAIGAGIGAAAAHNAGKGALIGGGIG